MPEETKTVFLVIEEYDPYLDYPDISSRAELTIHGVYGTLEKALDIRRALVEADEEEYGVNEYEKFSEEQYNNRYSRLKHIESTYYISEYEVR